MREAVESRATVHPVDETGDLVDTDIPQPIHQRQHALRRADQRRRAHIALKGELDCSVDFTFDMRSTAMPRLLASAFCSPMCALM